MSCATAIHLLSILAHTCGGPHRSMLKKIVDIIAPGIFQFNLERWKSSAGTDHVLPLEFLNSLPAHFERAEALQQAVQKHQNRAASLEKQFGFADEGFHKRMRVMERAIVSRNLQIKASVFTHWQWCVKLTQHKLRMLSRRSKKIYFDKWKLHRAERSYENVCRAETMLRRESVQWEEAATIFQAKMLNFEKTNATLKTQLAHALDVDERQLEEKRRYNSMVEQLTNQIRRYKEACRILVNSNLRRLGTCSLQKNSGWHCFSEDATKIISESLSRQMGETEPGSPQLENAEYWSRGKELNSLTMKHASDILLLWLNVNLRGTMKLTSLQQLADGRGLATVCYNILADEGKDASAFKRISEMSDAEERCKQLCAAINLYLNVPDALVSSGDLRSGESGCIFSLVSFLFLTQNSLLACKQDYAERQVISSRLATLEAQASEILTAESLHDEKRATAALDLATSIVQLDGECIKFTLQLQKGAYLTRQCKNWISHMSFSDMGSRARGAQGAVALAVMKEDLDAYVHLNRHEIADLLAFDDDPDAELLALEKVVLEYFPTLRRAFRFYSSVDSGESISQNAFNIMMDDTKCLDFTFSAADCQIIFLQTNQEYDAGGKIVNDEQNPDGSLTRSEFVEALIRIAYAKYRGKAKTELALSLKKLLENHIIPYAKRSDADIFRKYLRSEAMVKVLSRHQERLEEAFAKTAGRDGKISLAEFLDFLRVKKVLEQQRLSEVDVISIFNCVQVSSEEVDEDQLMESQMDFDEFTEALISISIFHNPLPYLALEQRLEAFLLEKIY